MNKIDFENGKTKANAETMNAFQDNIEKAINEGSKVTGVKGNAEASYRTGNVNITPANIGAAKEPHSHDYLPLSGGILIGQLTSRTIIPNQNNTHNLGGADKQFNGVYTRKLVFNNGNAFDFSWGGTGDLKIGIDSSERHIPTMEDHSIKFDWTEQGLGVFIDNTFIGHVSLV